jgi:hypothetical protein
MKLQGIKSQQGKDTKTLETIELFFSLYVSNLKTSGKWQNFKNIEKLCLEIFSQLMLSNFCNVTFI